MYGIANSLLALLFIGVLLFLAKMAEEVFERAKLVPYVAAVFVGILIGPGVLGLVSVLPNISLFISVGINFLLFTAGALEFRDVDILKILNFRNIAVGIAEFVLPFTLISFVVFQLTHSIEIALIAGVVMGMSSAGPLTRLLSDTGLNKTEEGNRIFQQVVIIEITAVILFSFLTELYRKAITIPVVLSVTGELVLSLVLIILFSRYFLTYFFRKLDTSSRAHETLIASIIAVMLILGFFGQLYGFNSAIIALFLGIMLREFIKERPLVAEKVSTVTYGFFEPLFFIGLGLYFVRITPELLFLGALFLLTGLSLKPIAGWLFAKKVNVGRIRNALGTSVNGGVDAALLVVAFTLTMVSRYYYSVIMFAITLLTLVVPLLFNIGTPIVPKDKSRYVWNIVESELRNVTAGDVSKTLPTVSVRDTDTLITALRTCINLNARAAIVTDSRERVVGEIALRDMLILGEDKLRSLRVNQMALRSAISVHSNSSASDLINIFRTYDPPIVAVVDDNERFTGTVLEREIVKYISNILVEKK